ncbi:MAG: M20/M25/M40 family metallo-hydrolase [Gemmatimonadaceae bacterium]|nr:M20/M25/M40 family metallo-hydrolase [Gemmatimonadaceae bacterium]
MPGKTRLTIALVLSVLPAALPGQTFRSADTVIRNMWRIGMEQSQLEPVAQVLIDSIGPRLSGSPGFSAATLWLEGKYRSWGIPVRREQYGTWRGWRQGAVHMELIAPRVQNLEVKLLAWSPPTPNDGQTEADVAVIPALADSTAARRWLATVRGKFVLADAPEIMCRAPQELERYARAATVTKVNAQRAELARTATERLRALAPADTKEWELRRVVQSRLDSAGVAGIGTLTWSGGWGVDKVFGAFATRAPSLDLSCEDYGLLHRLATNGQGPRIRLTAESQATPAEVPMFDVVAELRGTELPNEYVLLSAHLDSWHGATGATDNGTGTLTMLEAMRILRATYPHPRRTIIAGHWGGEEQGANGSLAFAEDHPEVIQGLQVAFNQDNGTWRVELLEGQGFLGASANLAKWVAQLPTEMTDSVRLQLPGPQANAGSDHTSFLCRGAPAFRLQSGYTEYRQYTWHTNRDTYDKIVFDDLKNNATMAAMLAYAASEDRERTSRVQAVLPPGTNGQPRSWPTCGRAQRSYARPPASPGRR